MEPQERKAINKEISRSYREDYRAYISSVVDQIGKAADCGNPREVNKLTKSISSDKKTSSIMPSKGEDGATFTSSKQLLDFWEKFMTDKFACADSPGVTYNPGLDQRLPEEDLTPREEFDECVQALRSGKAPGWDGAPIEVYLASESAYNELYQIVCLIWSSELIPEELVFVEFIMLYKKGSRQLQSYRSTVSFLQSSLSANTAQDTAIA